MEKESDMALTQEQIKEVNSYKEVGMSLSWISRKTNIPLGKIKYLAELGLLVKTKKRTKKDLFCNYRFFSKIDTEEKAYWLGFIYADGCVNDKGSLSILLSTKDRHHLLKFKQHINAEHPVRDGSHKREANAAMNMREGIQYYSVIVIHSGEMSEDLHKVGVFPRKSLALDFPTSEMVEDSLMPHFLRGYMDGDGYVCYKKSTGRGDSTTIGFVSSDIFCEKMSKFLSQKLNINPRSIDPHPRTRGIAKLSYGGKMDFLKIRKYFYENATIFLERKKEKFFYVPDRDFLFAWHKIVYLILTTNNELIDSKFIKKETEMDRRIIIKTIKKMEKLGIIEFLCRDGTSLRIFKKKIPQMTNENAKLFIDNLANENNLKYCMDRWPQNYENNLLTHKENGEII